MYTIAEVTSQETWDSLAGNVLLQSWGWGEFQKKIGHKLWRIGIFDRGTFVGGASIILVTSRLRSHLYVANGPFVITKRPDLSIPTVLETLLPHLKQLANNLSVHFIRFDPILENSTEIEEELLLTGLKKAPTYVQPEKTIIVDLTPAEDDILMGMSPSQRNGVKRGIKDGVTVRYSTSDEDFDIFWKMYQNTVSLKHFVSYSRRYYHSQLEVLKQYGTYEICIASVNNVPQTASLITYDRTTAYYLHTGRAYSNSPVTKHASKVQVWELMKHAKARGLKAFNLYGIAKQDNDPYDPWAGLTEFKRGFGGKTIEYVGAYDYPIDNAYKFIWLMEKTRKLWGYPYYLLKKLSK
ncbi:peptidoglycan bridge formation glycyltransferase FemA/FemB family protein [bacterium]|nr:peptidoglycan bridge formation glycyltransferase FemA/FemB family protein [bacterium]